MSQPLGFADIQRRELGRLLGTAMAVRVAIVPLAAALVALVIALDPTPWRAWLLGLALAALAVGGAAEWARFRRTGFRETTLRGNIAVMSLFQLAIVFATGGLESPLAPAIPLLSAIGALLCGPHPALALVAGPQLLALWALTLGALYGFLPAINLSFFGGGLRAGHNDAHLWTSAAVLTLLVCGATAFGLRFRAAFDAMLRQALAARQDELAAHEAHARELTTLSGEIAHELKNPLATVKGLAALLERDAAGRAAERLGVLRGEVDRMQGILEEFLNFSRPLAPLAQRDVDLAALCEEVAELHEGMARGRGVGLAVAPGAAPIARADPRKVRQILINLLQNALEASPAGAEVELACGADGGGAWIEVRDRGAGLVIAAERAFEPGVTSKETGSGLGLTIARALARQHGGEVALGSRIGGGCCARLALPGGER